MTLLTDKYGEVPSRDLEEYNGICTLVDADLLVYRVGFAGQTKTYTVKDPSGASNSSTFDKKKEAVAHCDMFHLDPDTSIKENVYADDLDLLKARMDTMLDKIRDDVHREVNIAMTDTRALAMTEYLFLTGCGEQPNFRDEVEPSYKANRAPNSKPHHYLGLREFLGTKANCVLSEGAEADDYLGPAAKDVHKVMPDSVPIIVSLDKDLDMIPGWHYNFVKETLYHQSEMEAVRFFFLQMLMGDNADNIKALHKVGPVKANKILDNAAGALDPFIADQEQIDAWYEECRSQYTNHFGTAAESKWNINCDLLWIWRSMPDDCPFKIQPAVIEQEIEVNFDEVPF